MLIELQIIFTKIHKNLFILCQMEVRSTPRCNSFEHKKADLISSALWCLVIIVLTYPIYALLIVHHADNQNDKVIFLLFQGYLSS